MSSGLGSTSCSRGDTLTASPAARSLKSVSPSGFSFSRCCCGCFQGAPCVCVCVFLAQAKKALRCSLAEAPGPWTPPTEALTAAMARFKHQSPTAGALIYEEGGGTRKQAFDVLQNHRISDKVHLLFDILKTDHSLY